MGKLFNRKKHPFSEDERDDEIDDDEIKDENDDDDEEEDDDDEEDEEEDDDDEEEEDEDEEDDDDEDEEDNDEDDDEEDEENEVDKRSYRRKRRIRNQIIVYGVVAVFVAALAAGGIAAGHQVSQMIKEKRLVKEMEAAQLAAQQEQQQPEPEDMIVEAPPEIEVATMDEQLNEYIDKCIAEMPLEDKVSGLFIVTPEALTGVATATRAGDGTQQALNNYAVGGLIYFGHNIVDKEQLTEMLSNTVSMSKYPVFLAVDEEGGSVSRVADSSIEVTKVDDMAAIGANGDTVAAYEAGSTIGAYLSELGFNLDFAPVSDVLAEEKNEALGTRAFGTDPSVCADMVSNVVGGIQGANVSACLKHFPGIGSAQEDTHDGRVETTKTLEEMRTSDFVPFQAGIGAGVDFVMVGHIVASGLDGQEIPSSMSSVVVTDLLRGELGFGGVIITDALNMAAVTDYYTSEEAALQALNAGVDMLLMPEDFEAAYNAVLEAVQNGTISEERINESLRRIYRIKYEGKLE